MADFIEGPDDDRVLPITGASTARQKVQRSFAQEFLCPADALAAMVRRPYPSVSELEAAADHFEVSDFTVRSALVNRGFVDRQYLPD
jgi:Zn-dependent peptidase ImmA (M78 family)